MAVQAHPEDCPRGSRGLQTGPSQAHRIVRPDNTLRWIEARCVIFYNKQGIAQRVSASTSMLPSEN
jgi:hypothetical protein